MTNNEELIIPFIHSTYSNLELDIVFPANLTLLVGDSATGRTFLGKALSGLNYPILYFDYTYLQKNKYNIMLQSIETNVGFLIIVDNADILLDDKLRQYIAFDKKNQYLIIGRNPEHFFLSAKNIVKIKAQNNVISFIQPFYA